MDPVEERLVVPFYLKMMGLNARNDAAALWDDLLRAGGAASLGDVQQLLAPDHWRPVVMGTWFALRYDAEQVGADLLGAIDRCRGSLTAPALATVSSLLLGADAAPALTAYVERDLAGQDGSATFVAAVLADLGCAAPVVPEVPDRDAAAAMLALGRRLREELSRRA